MIGSAFKLITSAAAISAVAMLLALPKAHAADGHSTQTSASFQFQLGVVIPVKCRLELSAPATAGGLQNPVTMRQFCNSRAGYQVLATYDQQAMNGASVVIDGQNFALNDGGQTLIVDSNLPAISSKQFAFIPASTTPLSATLSLAIVAKI